MNLFVLVGHGNAGKSSAIRALTGVGNTTTLPAPISMKGNIWKVAFNNGVFDCFVLGLSLQEAGIDPAQFYAGVNSSNCSYAFTALRYYATNTLGDAQYYIDEFNRLSNRGWNIDYIIIGPGALNRATGATAPIGPSNQIAALGRSRWGIL